jgi:hypothetical protein
MAWRPLVRAIHRDAGYLAIGLTLVYAISGLAINHVGDWDPDFVQYRRVHELGPSPAETPQAAAGAIAARLGARVQPEKVYLAAPDQLEFLLGKTSIHANPQTGHVVEEGQKARPLLRVVNWLHRNRGKPAWKLFADLYAIGLLLLAATGLFMLPLRHGLWGRGGVMVLLGLAIPMLYLLFAGGPE